MDQQNFNKPHKELRKEVKWGTYGKHGNDPLRYVTLEHMTDDHIKAILRTQHQIVAERRACYIVELELRAEGIYHHVVEGE